MTETIKNIHLSLHGMGIYWEVSIIAFMAYYLVRQHLTLINVKWAALVPMLIALISEFAFSWPTAPNYAQDILMNIVMSVLTGGIGIAGYSMADKWGWMDKLGEAIGKKISRTPGGPAGS